MHTVLIHEYYSRFDQNAIFVTVDTTLRSNRLDIRAFVKSKVGLPNKTEGVIFTPVPCEVVYFEPERVGVSLLHDSLRSGEPTTPVLSSFEQVERYVHECVDNFTIPYNGKIWCALNLVNPSSEHNIIG